MSVRHLILKGHEFVCMFLDKKEIKATLSENLICIENDESHTLKENVY